MYNVDSHPMGDYITGRGVAGEQVLIGLRYPYVAGVLFDASGRLVECRLRPLPFHARSMDDGKVHLIEDPDFQESASAYIASWEADLGVTEQPIVVDRFAIHELALAIVDLPRHLAEFQRSPIAFSDEEREDYPQIIRQWISEGSFVLRWGSDYYLDRSGAII